MTTQDRRATFIAAMVLGAAALVSTQLPLFNYLGFEFSVIVALVASFVCGLLHLSYGSRLVRGSSYAQFVLRSLAISFGLLVIPAAVSSLNALFVKNCSFTQGVLFYLLSVVPAVFFSICLGTLVITLTDRWRRSWFVAIMVGLLLHVVFVTVTRPQIFAFNYIVGFFPGITYDETLHVEGRLLLFRIETILVSLLLLGLGRWIESRKRRPIFGVPRGESGDQNRGRRIWSFGTLAVAVAWCAFVLWGADLGLSSSRALIEERLGGRIEGDHVIIIYPRATLTANEAQRLLDLHEFLFDEVSAALRVHPRRKLTSFVYASPRQKGELIGATGTNIAKPWLFQLHMNLGDVDAVLKHEMVHVLASEFGILVFGVGRNPGLIEGLAVAVERQAYGEPLHRLARSIELLGIPTDINHLFSLSGFVRAPGTVSYTIAGSFNRFLIDRYGMRRFKRLYRTGSFEEVYRKPLDRLQGEWRSMLRSIQPSEAELAKASYLFVRPSIFGKVCARVIADLNDRTRSLLARAMPESALVLARRSLSLTKTPEATILSAGALFRLGRYEEVARFAADALEDSVLRDRLLPLRRTLGLAQWSLGRTAEARQNFEVLKSTRISLAWAEDAALCLRAMEEQRPSVLFGLVSGLVADSLMVDSLSALLRSRSARSSTLEYLLGLAFDRRGERDSATMAFGRARFGDPVLEYSRVRHLAVAEFATGQYQRAKMHFWEALNFLPPQASQVRIDEWIRRCDWMIGKAEADPNTRTDGDGREQKTKLIFAHFFRLLRSLHSPTERTRGVFV